MIQTARSKEGTNAAGPSRGILRPMLGIVLSSKHRIL